MLAGSQHTSWLLSGLSTLMADCLQSHNLTITIDLSGAHRSSLMKHYPVFAFEPQVLFWRFHDVWAEGTFLPNSGILSTTSLAASTCFCHKHHLGMASPYWCGAGRVLTLNLMQNVGSSEITVKIYKLATNEASSAGIFNVLSNISYTVYWGNYFGKEAF